MREHAPAPLVWRNPLFIKGMRQRMRWRPLATWVLVVLTVTAFIFMLSFMTPFSRLERPADEAAKLTIIPLLIVQGVLLMLLGTGAIASGIATERDSGVFVYQRLTPMSPARKILGYLFGLPAKEYFLFALTMPFMIFSIIVGRVSIPAMANIYLVLFSSIWLYHLAGMTAGMVSSKPRLASMLSQGLVITLYLVLPALSNVGFTLFEYLTVRPVVRAMLASEMAVFGPAVYDWVNTARFVEFFTFELHVTVYSLLMQGCCIIAFLTAVYRRWLRQEAHIFGKWFAVGFCLVLQFLLLGSLWPQLTGGGFESRFMRQIAMEFGEAGSTMLSLYVWSILAVIAVTMLINLTTPTVHGYVRGLRRARKLGLSRLPLGHDTAGSTPIAVGLAATLVLGYVLTVRPVLGLRGVFEEAPGLARLASIPLLLVGLTFYVQAARQRFGARGLFVIVFVIWVIPALAFAVMAASKDALRVPGYYVALPSPGANLMYATLNLVGLELEDTEAGHLPALTWLSVVFNLTAALLFGSMWQRRKRQLHAAEAEAAASTESAPGPAAHPAASPEPSA